MVGWQSQAYCTGLLNRRVPKRGTRGSNPLPTAKTNHKRGTMKKDIEEELIATLKEFGVLHDEWHAYYYKESKYPKPDKYFLGKAHTFAYVFSKLCEVLEIDEQELMEER